VNALAINGTAAAIVPAHDLPPALFDDFISFIDRGEKTTRTYITNLRQFAAWLAFSAIRRPARQHILSYRDYLAAEHDAIQLDPGSANGWTYRTDSSGNRYKVTCKPNTVKQYLQSVRQFFAWTAANGFYPNIAANIHAPKVRLDVHRKDALTAADVLTIEKSIKASAAAKIEAAAGKEKDPAGRISRATEQGKRDYAIYVLAVNAGLRTVEISRANVKDLEVKGSRAVLYVWGKGHAEADTKKPIAPEVYAAIREYLDSRSDRPTANSPLFVATGNRSGGKRIAPTTISKMLKRAMQRAGYNSEKLTAHSLRHSAAMGVLEITGSNLYETQKYMRHESPDTTEIYLHETEEQEQQQADLAQQLYSFFNGEHVADGNRRRLENIINRMNPQQIEQLTGIAQALAR
jgi:integrase/recombinase XerD